MEKKLVKLVGIGGVIVECIRVTIPTAEGFTFEHLSRWRFSADELEVLREESRLRGE